MDPLDAPRLLGQAVDRGDAAAIHASALAASDVSRLAQRLEELEDQVNRLSLFTTALCQLLSEHGVEEQKILARVLQLDQSAGGPGGKLGPAAPEPCPQCHRPMAARQVRCIYCGNERSPGSAHGALGR